MYVKPNRGEVELKSTIFIILALVLLLNAGVSSLKADAIKNWNYVGGSGLTAGEAQFSSVAIGTDRSVYVAYRDASRSNKVTVIKYNGANWEVVGQPGISSNAAQYITIKLASDNTPYVAYRDTGAREKATVMKFNGTSWEVVGKAGFSADMIYNISLALGPTNTPYVAYIDGNSNYSNKATVMKFNNTSSSWEYVGAAEFSADLVTFISIAVGADDTPYVAYGDKFYNYKATVMKYNGQNWVSVGPPGFTADRAAYTSIVVGTNNTVYVAFRDVGNSSKTTVMKYTDTGWSTVGTAGISAGEVTYISLAIAPDQTLYVAYQDRSLADKVVVQKYDGTNWEIIGSAAASSGAASYISLAVDEHQTPFVAYRDGSTMSYKLSLLTYEAASVAPTASAVSVSGAAKVGETLTGNYTYTDVDGDEEGPSLFKWYRADDRNGTNKAVIAGTTTNQYVLTLADQNKYISFEVTPLAKTGLPWRGTTVESPLTNLIGDAEAAPMASDVAMTGTAQVGQTLTGSYTYADINGDAEGTSIFSWYRATNASGTDKIAISGATQSSYVLTPTDLNKYISFEVTPIAQSGIEQGTAVASAYTSRVVEAEAAPVASGVAVSGSLKVGQTLTGLYVYADVNADAEGASTFKWYRSNDASGAGKTAIAGVTQKNYVLTPMDLNKYISFEVTPVAKTGILKGVAVESLRMGKAVAAEAAPVASAVTIAGTAKIGQTLTGSYAYSDVNGDTEGTSIFRWYRAMDARGKGKVVIGGATQKKYVLTSADLNKYVSFEVTPIAKKGSLTGTATSSLYKGPITR